MALASGTRLGVYEITAQIGAGGMGEVYRATDPKLKRQVAIKILPPAFAADRDRLARFQREAEVLASLSHPNIAAIYGLEDSGGATALVMELIEGEDLSQRIARGAMPIDEALPVAKQVAEALDAAHGQGIVHRDLKPANIKVRPDGTVKVLDFGLAKAIDPNQASQLSDNSPTVTSPAMTAQGVILGTAAYMSPEQARGKTVDKRADIWAFGCVLYEMLTGRRPFQGEDVTDTLAAIVRSNPELSSLPEEVRRLVESCLQKDPRKRLRDIGDAWKLVEQAEKPSSGQSVSTNWLPWSIAVASVVALLVFVLLAPSRQQPTDVPVTRFAIRAPANAVLDNDVAVAPDGRQFVFSAHGKDGVAQLWLQSLDSVTPQQLPGTSGAARAFWSPNGRSLGFFASSKLLRIDLPSGGSTPIADTGTPLGGYGASWGRDNVIVFAPSDLGPLYRVIASGGPPNPATTLDSVAGEVSHRFPSFLPDGKHFLYLAVRPGNRMTIRVGSLDAPNQSRQLVDAGSAAEYAQGHLIFVRTGQPALIARPFDPDRLEFKGDARVLTDSVQASVAGLNAGAATFSTGGGVAVYREPRARAQLTWFDRTGRSLGVMSELGTLGRVELSKSGTAATLVVSENGNRDIWIYDVVRGQRMTRVTADAANDDDGVWSPDDKTIVFDSSRTGISNLYRKDVDGPSGSERPLYSDSLTKFPMNFSPDGKYLVYFTFGVPKTRADIWVLPDPLTSPGKPFPFLATEAFETMPKFSPDGKWMAYGSDDTGRSEIWVAPFPGPGRGLLISKSGGTLPRWRHDGSELFYLSLAGDLMAVSVRTSDGALEVGSPVKLFGGLITTFLSYDISADGQRILAAVVPPGFEEVPITVVQNWTATLAR